MEKNQRVGETQLDKFIAYCRNNRNVILLLMFMTLAVYGAWAYNDFVTFDAEGFYSKQNGVGWYFQWIGLGRWSFVFLKKLLGVELINPFFSITVFFLCFSLSVILWAYVFSFWNKGEMNGKREKIGLLFWGIIYLTHPIWSLQFAYRNQIEVCCILMVILPIALLLLSRWLDEGNIVYGIISLCITVFVFAGYQSFVVVYLEAVAIYFIYLLEYIQDNGETYIPEFYKKLVKAALFSIAAYALYKVSCNVACKMSGAPVDFYTEYIQSLWKTESISACISNIAAYLKMSFLGDGRVYTCIYLVEIIVLIGILIYRCFSKKIMRVWYILVMAALVLIPFLLEFITAGNIVSRSQFAFVCSIAFLGMYEISFFLQVFAIKIKKTFRQLVIVALLVCICFSQIEMNTRLLYSDYKVSEEDYRMMEQIYYSALKKGAHEGDAIVFLGAHSNYADETIIENEVIGFSYFESIPLTSMKVVEAMQAYGFNVSKPSVEQTEYAQSLKDSMECYPSDNCVVIENGLIIVRLS